MKIITKGRELIYSNSIDEDIYSAANQKDSTASQALKDASKTSSDKKKVDWTKAKEGAKKAGVFLKDSGLIDIGKEALKSKLGVTQSTPSGLQADRTTTIDIPTQEEQGMSDTTKLLIGIGVVGVLGFVIYKATKK